MQGGAVDTPLLCISYIARLCGGESAFTTTQFRLLKVVCIVFYCPFAHIERLILNLVLVRLRTVWQPGTLYTILIS